MNPLGLVQAALVLLEGLARPFTSTARREKKSSERGFLLFYFVFLALGTAMVVRAARSISFAR